MNTKPIHIILLLLILSACNSSVEKKLHKAKVDVVNTIESIAVGESVSLQFSTENSGNIQLLCSSSYGNELLNPTQNKEVLNFEIPKNLTQKIGVLSWKILGAKNELSGNITIQPKTSAVQLETYVGPPSIETVSYTHLTLPTIA